MGSGTDSPPSKVLDSGYICMGWDGGSTGRGPLSNRLDDFGGGTD